jgi:hypothetical protein
LVQVQFEPLLFAQPEFPSHLPQEIPLVVAPSEPFALNADSLSHSYLIGNKCKDDFTLYGNTISGLPIDLTPLNIKDHIANRHR